jgi:hypothetical protein
VHQLLLLVRGEYDSVGAELLLLNNLQQQLQLQYIGHVTHTDASQPVAEAAVVSVHTVCSLGLARQDQGKPGGVCINDRQGQHKPLFDEIEYVCVSCAASDQAASVARHQQQQQWPLRCHWPAAPFATVFTGS